MQTHIKAIDQSLSALAEWLSTAVRGDMAARDAMRACAPTLLGCLDSLQRLPGEGNRVRIGERIEERWWNQGRWGAVVPPVFPGTGGA
jgi:hypothetical protein